MITIDIHSHTSHSHAANTVAEMAEAAEAAGMRVFGFSEHSPRPEGYNYPTEYRTKLRAGFPDYLAEVKALCQRFVDAPEDKKPMRVLLGLEVDWFPSERPFIERMINAAPYDYLIGSVHFLGTWGFDATVKDWKDLSDDACFAKYSAYFHNERDMAASGLMQVAAHPDLIKIFSVETFRRWIADDAHSRLVKDALTAMKDTGMAMEISAAGLRKPCKEIYPCPEIMAMAAKLHLPVSFASDAHAVEQVGWKFDELERYARSFGYTTSRYFVEKEPIDQAF